MNWLALDIGGANIKLADGLGFAISCSFPMWKRASALGIQLRTLIAEAPAADHLAITMTGELADCFATKHDGVKTIIDSVVEVSDGRYTRVYLSDGTLVTPQIAISKAHLAAASNWRALAEFSGRYAARGAALAIDVGSTTTDITPLRGGKVAAAALSDTERLLRGELVYTGVERSPICALVDTLPYRGSACPVAQEFFATTLDAYLLLERIAEDNEHTMTADNRGATRKAARTRMARMICTDTNEFNAREAVVAAQAVARRQAEVVATGLKRVVATLDGPVETVIFSGHGEFLAREACEIAGVGGTLISLSEKLGAAISRCAPAHALAVLAREQTASR